MSDQLLSERAGQSQTSKTKSTGKMRRLKIYVIYKFNWKAQPQRISKAKKLSTTQHFKKRLYTCDVCKWTQINNIRGTSSKGRESTLHKLSEALQTCYTCKNYRTCSGVHSMYPECVLQPATNRWRQHKGHSWTSCIFISFCLHHNICLEKWKHLMELKKKE